jgi:16S rRNA processing protein RimM
MGGACQQRVYSFTGHDKLPVINPYPPVDSYFLLGKTLKSHATSGQLRLMVENKFKGYFVEGEYIFFEIDGSKVPFKIEDVVEDAHFVMTLEDVHSKEVSDALSGKEIWIPLEKVKAIHQRAPRNIKDPWNEYFIRDEDSSTTHAILRTEEFPQQLMAVIDWKGREIYVPLHEQLISNIDRKEKIIYMKIPEGLLEL